MEVGFADEVFFDLVFGGGFFVEELPKFFREREIVMGAGNGLHFFTIARGKAFAVFGAFFGAVGLAVLGDFDVFFVG